MKKLPALFSALVVLVIVSIGRIAAQEPQAQTERRIVPPPPTLGCCECLGRTVQLDLSTGQGSGAVDPLWKVNGGPAYVTPPVSSWIALNPAKWIQPVASPTPSPSVPAGIYKYTVRFNVQKCTIPAEVRLDGKFAADNSAKAFLDGSPIAGASCPGPVCFAPPQAPVNLTVPSLSPGLHTLEIDVKNDEGYSGLIVNAQLKGQCRKEPVLP